ncbi:MAG: hypothetical protein GC171_01190 [Terrimonas sp.]|nr:hypothetical protein [Terrimonas sp.]
MAAEFERKDKQQKLPLHSLYNYIMGVVWLAVGLFFIFHKRLGYDLGRLQDDPVLSNIFGVSAILYGSFRLYRGYSKKR